MRFKVGDLVRVIQAADQSLWERSHVGQIGLIVETITYDQDYFRVRYLEMNVIGLIEDKLYFIDAKALEEL